MPIPEPAIYRPSNLTKQQKQDALAACYGVTMATEPMSEVEIARLRQILLQHDAEHKPLATIDLNNPPKVPYRHQKFPMAVYDHEHSQPAHDELRAVRSGNLVVEEQVHVPAKVVMRLVQNERELEAALDNGWSDKAPEYREEREEPLSAANEAEVARVQAQLDQKRPGRPARHKEVAA